MADSRTKLDNMTASDIMKIGEAKLPSPINLSVSSMKAVKLPTIVWHNADEPPRVMKITNCGFSLILTAKWHGPTRPYISGNHLPGKYIFSQAHFHWGKNDTRGSEHTIDGVPQPLELHVIYFKTDYKTMEEAMKTLDGIVVVAYLYNVRKEANLELKSIIENLVNVTQPNTSSPVELQPLSSFAPTFNNDYFLYWGTNLTSASYNILWIISRQAQKVSSEQLAELRKLIGANREPLADNFRELKSTNGRTILFANGKQNPEKTMLEAPPDPVVIDSQLIEVPKAKKKQEKDTKASTDKAQKRKSSMGRRKSAKQTASRQKSLQATPSSISDQSVNAIVMQSRCANTENSEQLELFESFEDYEPKELTSLEKTVTTYVMTENPFERQFESLVLEKETSHDGQMRQFSAEIEITKVISNVDEWEESVTRDTSFSMKSDYQNQLLGIFPDLGGQHEFPDGFITSVPAPLIEELSNVDIRQLTNISIPLAVAEKDFDRMLPSKIFDVPKPIEYKALQTVQPANTNPLNTALNEKGSAIEPVPNFEPTSELQESNNPEKEEPNTNLMLKRQPRQSYITQVFQNSSLGKKDNNKPGKPTIESRIPRRVRKSEEFPLQPPKEQWSAENEDKSEGKILPESEPITSLKKIVREPAQKGSKTFESPLLARKRAELAAIAKRRVGRSSPVVEIFGKNRDVPKTIPVEKREPLEKREALEEKPKSELPSLTRTLPPQAGVTSFRNFLSRNRYPILEKNCQEPSNNSDWNSAATKSVDNQEFNGASQIPPRVLHNSRQPEVFGRTNAPRSRVVSNQQRTNTRNSSPSWKY